MSPLQIAILEIVKLNDGKLSWYQIDRALANRGGVDLQAASMGLMATLRGLEAAGFIATNPGHHPAQPLYSLTPVGQQQLEIHGS
jgi:DNA-binding HxlR family transcriptional regulator